MPIKKTIILFLIAFAFSACRMSYSFTGASIPPQAKTISIDYFPNQASMVVPTLSQTLTETLRDRFTSQTPLQLVQRNGDLNIEGNIISYTTQPVAIQSTEQAAFNRLTISVRVKFTNKYDEKQNFEQTFTRFEDYPFTANLNAIQDNLIQLIVEALVDDIFNKAVVNW
ncbi:MAG: Uncharacterized protein XD81_1112 [Bacteroidetes bacterium 38_7]|nr:MAG: Uncharacterized protein XD81_1112 [Bacteroidetes bacterium 38_7]HAL64745.1 hypothetical protein [Bacteroidales bacterium]